MTEEAKDFDLEQVYDDEIGPLMEQIIAIAKRVDMPFVASFQYARTAEGDGDSFCTSGRTRPGCDRMNRAFRAVEIETGLRRGEPLHITTRDGDGRITGITSILP